MTTEDTHRPAGGPRASAGPAGKRAAPAPVPAPDPGADTGTDTGTDPDPAANTTDPQAEAIARDLLDRLDGDIRLALPLGLGKALRLTNALTDLVARTPGARLSILTALTLERPAMSTGMAARFLRPAADRLFGDYPELHYARMRRDGTLPANIELREFFLLAGRWLSVPTMQQDYIAANYTHALDMLRDWRPNLLLHLLAEDDAGQLSLGGNTDITADLLADRRAGRQDFILVGEVHPDLPVMTGPDASLPRSEVTTLYRAERPYDLFSVVKRPVGRAEHAIGLHVSRLVRDGGTLQIGIGAIGDAVAHALIVRQNGRTRAISRACPFAPDDFSAPPAAEHEPFDIGLYGVTEMLVDGMLQLFEAGILRREVEGAAIHAGFFVDCRDFYARLRALAPADRARIQMRPVSFTNALYGQEDAKRAARRHARFVNSAMQVTALGGVSSDAVDDGRVVSGAGGQFNFVEQAFALPEARAIITLPATRRSKGRVSSNIVWDRPHETVPRQYRDIVVTEYGIADLRARTDAEAIRQMLRITDSRFQEDLLARAKSAGKLPRDATLPEAWRHNTPEALRRWLAPQDLPDFPFGTDFDAQERALLPALAELSAAQGSRRALAGLLWQGLSGRPAKGEDAALARLSLAPPRDLSDRVQALALRGAWRRSRE
ncbi:acetyl-CoA hydrolase/transferase C-terminal domain-containing protein [Pseudooceanicola aestuarii]|uniref:acetyl-CoA hydrolase/transferase C-terminal domain-containing protein n=1 Tax=Pseudooceanicola aestuarii TaxID=2697319 RepID=UPI0013D81E92|nr:acetyl-CoA hydrolase/transferase C-terminal domain-containing protein [Pseudooceanicola aestuarii]